MSDFFILILTDDELIIIKKENLILQTQYTKKSNEKKTEFKKAKQEITLDVRGYEIN
jgi:hypothetical protein